MNFKFTHTPYVICIVMLTLTNPSYAKQWTLESSIAQATTASPEIKQAEAIIGERNAELEMTSLWPDPSIELRVDNGLGLDDGSGGYDLSEVTISQAIPINRIKHQKSVAEAHIESEKHAQQYKILQLQHRVSKIFYELQLASAQLELSGKRVKFADKLITSSLKNSYGDVVRYLTPLEKMRLSIIREKARQAETSAEGKFNEVLTEFYKVLNIAEDPALSVADLSALSLVPDLASLTELQTKHPLLFSQQQRLNAATNEIDVARSSATEDPTISLNRSTENFATGNEEVYGIMLNIQIPLQDRKSSAVSKASYSASQQRIQLERMKRELQINLNRSFTHLNHIIEQANDFNRKVLAPANEMLKLTNKGFISGELNVLSLVDANNTYFESRIHYLDLMYQSWVELAEVNLHAGKFASTNDATLSSYNTGGQ